ncbi:hypothetical protein Bca52824_065540 [Brassica carinata]|uniref:Uncharacterized protein n=1 Tax=Brassica carinata TaxID=52824 RepID=A0A8X7QM77_BRACI|nr:hypothetical protein Bca52824_065540 [Brassica carinata]
MIPPTVKESTICLFKGSAMTKHGAYAALSYMAALRRAIDYNSTVVRYIQARTWQRDSRDMTSLQATPAAAVDMLPPVAYSDNPSTSFAAKDQYCKYEVVDDDDEYDDNTPE